jgi:hypothetical protein
MPEQTNNFRGELLDEIARRTPYYVPEWRFNTVEPDAGTALAYIWADMLSGTLERFSRLRENYRRVLLDAVGSTPAKPINAKGYLVFSATEDDEASSNSAKHNNPPTCIIVPARTASEAALNAALETDRDLVVSSARITDIYLINSEKDICKHYDSLTDITLFADENKQMRIWTLRHPYAFNVRNSLRLSFGGVSPALLCGENVKWQFLSASAAEEADFDENHTAEWCDFVSVVPYESVLTLEFPNSEAKFCTAVRFTINDEAVFRGLPLSRVLAFSSESELLPDAVYTNDVLQLLPELQPTDEPQELEAFYPFGQKFMPFDCLNITCGEAFFKPGAAVELTFDLAFEKTLIDGYPDPQIRMKRIMKASDLRPPKEFEVTISTVAWEYFNGTGWAALPVTLKDTTAVLGSTASPGNLFAAGSDAFRRYSLSFTCPNDFQPIVCGAHNANFIRVRVIAVDNLFRQKGYYLSPRIKSLRFSYNFERGIKITDTEVKENLTFRRVTLDAPTPIITRLQSPAAMYFAFDKPFEGSTILFELRQGSRQAAPQSPLKLNWEYYSTAGWTTPDIHDETLSFSVTGLITFQAPVPCEKFSIAGQTAYWWRLVYSTDCEASSAYARAAHKPVICRFWHNAVSAKARTPGTAANLPAYSFQSLTAPIAGIAEVFNPLSSSGGCDEETESAVISRLTAAFNHGGRAISRYDYESLTRQASIQVVRCRCYPNTDSFGVKALNHICLAVLQADTHTNFLPLQKTVLEYISARQPLTDRATLHITEPAFITVSLTIRAVAENMNLVFVVKRRVFDTLANFLDPITGGIDGQGWEIGTLPSPQHIASVLRRVPGVLYLESAEAAYNVWTGAAY